MAQMVKNLPAMPETQIRSLGREDPLEKGMATHSRILTWRIPWTEEHIGLHRVRHYSHFFMIAIFLVFTGISRWFSLVAIPIYISTYSVGGILSSIYYL